MRKKFFNMMEDMKGKIRVYARVRPMLQFEKERGQKVALNIPDELTLDHIWKEKKREYQFDAVFEPVASQEKVSVSPSKTFLQALTKLRTALTMVVCLGINAQANHVHE